VSRFLAAARGQPVDVTPIWLMRQAGRSLPEYRRLRESWSLVEIIAQPELCAEVTLQPVRRLGVDAAVMFADIMLPLRGMGVAFDLRLSGLARPSRPGLVAGRLGARNPGQSGSRRAPRPR